MNDTPRVTVPVDLEFTHYRRSQITHLRPYVAGEALSDRVSISAADLEAGSPKPGDMIARNPANHDDQWLVAADYFAANFEPVSAAPAPEGGAVLEDALDEWIVEGMRRADQRSAEIDPVGCSGMTPEDVKSGRVAAYQKGFQNGVKSTLTDASFVIMNAALATREAGEREAFEAWYCADAAVSGLNMTPKEIARLRDGDGYGKHRHTLNGKWDGWQARAALRAQPPAREDAQPVWVDGVPTKHHAKEWFIAETTFGDRVVLKSLPEEYTYDFKTADETYIKADRIKRWMPFPDSQYLFPHPAPDALRSVIYAATDAVLPAACDTTGNGTQARAKMQVEIADGIIAALQAEQKGGAA